MTSAPYRHGGPAPFAHQLHAFETSRDRKAFALLCEQGTGKSKMVVDTACWLWQRGEIDGVLVICPNSVKTNWVTDEIPRHHSPDVPWVAAWWSANGRAVDRERWRVAQSIAPPAITLPWLVVNVESLSARGEAYDACERFLDSRRVLLVVDESSKIKNRVKRTKAVIKLGQLAAYRRICSGTPVTQGPLDLFTQFRFLDSDILGFDTFTAYKNRYALFDTRFGFPKLIKYLNLDELQAKIAPHSYRVTRAECLDLPPKVYQKLEVDLAPAQRKAYNAMRDQMLVELGDGRSVSATIVLTKLLRLQQITGGFLPFVPPPDVDEGMQRAGLALCAASTEPLPGPNPKVEALLDFVEQVPGKVIVWARFRAELEAITHALVKEYGADAVVEFHGGVSDEGRTYARQRFQDAALRVRFFVAQTDVGGYGLTLTAAQSVVYYSNTFSLEARLQSEDRAMRIGQTGSVTYVDLIARDTLDNRVLQALRGKQDLASLVLAEPIREWI